MSTSYHPVSLIQLLTGPHPIQSLSEHQSFRKGISSQPGLKSWAPVMWVWNFKTGRLRFQDLTAGSKPMFALRLRPNWKLRIRWMEWSLIFPIYVDTLFLSIYHDKSLPSTNLFSFLGSLFTAFRYFHHLANDKFLHLSIFQLTPTFEYLSTHSYFWVSFNSHSLSRRGECLMSLALKVNGTLNSTQSMFQTKAHLEPE